MEYLDIDKFATVINCMDGRTQIPVLEWIIENFDIDYPDMITEAGPIKILAENKNKELVEAIKERVDISINKHHSKKLFIVGHFDCAGNPEEKETQLKQIEKSIKHIRKWGYPIEEIIGLWVDDNWKVNKISHWKSNE